MLRYAAGGTRRYGVSPIGVVTRLNWEFEAVLDGRMAPVLRSGPLPLRGRTLWIFPPDLAHGWTGDGDRPCEVAVMQVPQAPEPLAALARARGHLAVALDAVEAARVRDLITPLIGEVAAPTSIGHLLESRALAELCLLGLRDEPRRRLPAAERGARDVVAAALAWYVEHLERDPTLAQVAAAVGMSESHLRRLAHQAHRRSPRALLEEARFAHALELMRAEGRSLLSVARACGYGDLSAFSRAFARRHGKPPSQWRTSLS